jgi:hypothetical protein
MEPNRTATDYPAERAFPKFVPWTSTHFFMLSYNPMFIFIMVSVLADPAVGQGEPERLVEVMPSGTARTSNPLCRLNSARFSPAQIDINDNAMGDLLSILKFTALFLSGVFSLCALLGTNRDENGHLTLWGKIAISGVVISTLIAATSQALEFKTSHAQQLAAAVKNTELLKEISRAVYPIKPPGPIECDIAIAVRLDDSLNSYRVWLNGICEKVPKQETPDSGD